ncbi:MAG: PEP-CTERM sorting domain-containing protein [Candidatus Electrothrix sp. AX5]|nr:PEP-CTERM sorting domain-containing protein [Candidatus Electrothrix sp. AX5]
MNNFTRCPSQDGIIDSIKEIIMKNIVKKSMVPVFAAAFCVLAAGQAQAVSVNVFQVDLSGSSYDDHIDNNSAIMTWFASQGMNTLSDVNILEDFEGQNPYWYQKSEPTGVGTFTATGNPGTGSTSYNSVTGNDSPDPHFRVRNFDANGRYNVFPIDGGTNYLDSADITELTLVLTPGLDNLFFTVTDASDIRAVTTTNVGGVSGDINFRQRNGSLWFVGIDGEGEDLTTITWATNHVLTGNPYSNDGFGLDSFGTVNSVPEPATALLLGAGLLPLMGFLRRKKEEDEV